MALQETQIKPDQNPVCCHEHTAALLSWSCKSIVGVGLTHLLSRYADAESLRTAPFVLSVSTGGFLLKRTVPS